MKAAPISLPATMRAVEITQPGGPEVLRMTTCPIPQPGPEDILIRIAYAGVNRPDALQRAGLYAPPPGASPLPGLEASGKIVAVGAAVTKWAVGDMTCALLPGGGYAEYALTDQHQALPLPKGLDLRAAACLPETCFTTWSNIIMRGGLKAGERCLIHGGTSGIGTTAIQIARNIGAEVWATAGSDTKKHYCEKLGATRAFNYRTEEWDTALKEAGGANLILDMVGGPYIRRNLRSLTDDGRLVQIAFLQGPKVELNCAEIMMRRLTFTGSTLRPQSNTAKAAIAAEVYAHIWPMIAEGDFAPVIDSTYALEDAAEAHSHMESSTHIGKIVLEVDRTITTG